MKYSAVKHNNVAGLEVGPHEVPVHFRFVFGKNGALLKLVRTSNEGRLTYIETRVPTDSKHVDIVRRKLSMVKDVRAVSVNCLVTSSGHRHYAAHRTLPGRRGGGRKGRRH